MTSDDTQARGDVPWRQIGVGCRLGLYCMTCHRKNVDREGGKFFGPFRKLFRCAACVKQREAACAS